MSSPEQGKTNPSRAEPVETSAGAVIGPYRLLERIGEGGMGEVWLAEQTQPVRRRVAIKLIKAGMDTREVVSRFASERQALALMDHPAIAKVFDAGSTPQGRLYFVMEYVEGIPITEYCDQHRLTIRDRLELFVRVCEGVQHAHQKAILHRDLKPSNILVGEMDGRPVPRIIDFGVAKAITRGLGDDTLTTFTRAGSVVGTPAYMSPEQADSAGQDVDTRTDVYSLGVVLYELLVGALPFDLTKVPLDQIPRKLREEDAPSPSTKLRSLHDESSTTAQKRHTDPPTLIRQLRGDLDAIALKALEKDRSRRYGSPLEFASDIGRYLAHKPVVAVAPSFPYRTGKFVRRYRSALVIACGFVLVLLVAAAVSIRQGLRANQQAALAQAVNNFLRNDLLAQASADVQSEGAAKADPDIKVRTALDRAAARIGGKFDRQPEVEASIRDTIGQTYLDLGLYAESRKQYERAVELYRRALGPENPKTLKSASRVGRIAELQGRFPEAEGLVKQTLDTQRRVLGSDNRDTLSSLVELANLYYSEGKFSQAEAPARESLEIARRVLGPEHPDTLVSLMVLANVYSDQGNYSQAEAYDTRILAIRRRVSGPEHPKTLAIMDNLAGDYLNQGEYEKAESMASQSLEIERRVLGPEHPDTLSSVDSLANIYNNRGKYIQAEMLLSPSLEISRRVLGPEHSTTLIGTDQLANSFDGQGKYDQADQLFHKTLDASRRVLGPEHPFTIAVLSDISVLYLKEGNFDRAEKYATEALAARRRTLGSENLATMDAAVNLGLAYFSQKKAAEAEPLAREALQFSRKTWPNTWPQFEAESLLAACLTAQGKYSEAEPLLVRSYQGMSEQKDRVGVPLWFKKDLAHQWIIELYQAWGKPKDAAAWMKK